MIRPTKSALQFGVVALCLSCLLLLVKISPIRLNQVFNIQQSLQLGHTAVESLDLASADLHDQVTIVVASQTKDDTRWIRDAFSRWTKRIYVTDDPQAEYAVQKNRGREGMVYLTYTIDNYHNLSDVTIFSHANRYQWHNDDPMYDGQRMLQRLQIRNIVRQGYVNLRCTWVLGCPNELRPTDLASHEDEVDDERAQTVIEYAKAFETLFPDIPVPDEVGASCCAQFAVSAIQIRERPLSDYVHYRQWLLDTDLSDHVSGRILEYSWHIIFGQGAVFCPDARECYCRTYGLCSLDCQNEGTCESQYELPPSSTMPQHWPKWGFQDEWRDVKALQALQDLAYSPEST